MIRWWNWINTKLFGGTWTYRMAFKQGANGDYIVKENGEIVYRGSLDGMPRRLQKKLASMRKNFENMQRDLEEEFSDI